MLNLSS